MKKNFSDETKNAIYKTESERRRDGSTLVDPGVGYAEVPQGSADTPEQVRDGLQINPDVEECEPGK